MRRTLWLAAAVVATLLFSAPAQALTTNYYVGIDQPGDLNLGPDGTLYVTSWAFGGERCYSTDPGDRKYRDLCVGKRGRVYAFRQGQRSVALSGLPANAIYPVATTVRSDGQVLALLSADTRDELKRWPKAVRALAGAIQSGNGSTRATMANLAEYSIRNPNIERKPTDEAQFDSDEYPASYPVAIAALPDRVLAADFESGLVTSVTGSTVTPLGARWPLWAAPTAMAVGPDGSIYVATYPGAPSYDDPCRATERGDDGSLWRIPPGAIAAEQIAEGFTPVTDLSVAPDGAVFAVQQWTKRRDYCAQPRKISKTWGMGSVVQVNPDGTKRVISDPELPVPAGVAADATSVYVVTNHGSNAKRSYTNAEIARIAKRDFKADQTSARRALKILDRPGRIVRIAR